MPNQNNYADKITSTEYKRPSRVNTKDSALVQTGQEQVLFGTRSTDVVEIWIYNPDGTFAAHTVLDPNSEDLSATTLVDVTGAQEVLNIDMRSVTAKLGVAPGRYALVANIFRNEVGSEAGYKLYISEISSDRTEVRLSLVDADEASLYDLYEFVVPSVPRRFAEGLIDQTFGKSLDATVDDSIQSRSVMDLLNIAFADTETRISKSESVDAYNLMFQRIIDRTHAAVIEAMAEDLQNFNIQEIELYNYIEESLESVIYSMKLAGEIDPRFELI